MNNQAPLLNPPLDVEVVDRKQLPEVGAGKSKYIVSHVISTKDTLYYEPIEDHLGIGYVAVRSREQMAPIALRVVNTRDLSMCSELIISPSTYDPDDEFGHLVFCYSIGEDSDGNQFPNPSANIWDSGEKNTHQVMQNLCVDPASRVLTRTNLYLPVVPTHGLFAKVHVRPEIYDGMYTYTASFIGEGAVPFHMGIDSTLSEVRNAYIDRVLSYPGEYKPHSEYSYEFMGKYDHEIVERLALAMTKRGVNELEFWPAQADLPRLGSDA